MKTALFCVGIAGLTATTLAMTTPARAQSSLPQPPYRIDELTPALLAAGAAAGLSLLVRFVPGVRDWFDAQSALQKQWTMFALTAVVALTIGVWNMAATGFTQDALVRLLFALFAALTSNQVTYQFIKQP